MALGALVAILLIANAIVISVFGRRLEKRIEAIRVAGDPVSLPDLAPEAVPLEQNAAIFLRRAQGDIEAVSKELYAVYGKKGFYDGLLSETDLKFIESAFKAYPNVIPLLQQAAECPDYDPQLDYTVGSQVFLTNSLSHLQNLRPAYRLLAARVHLLVSQGDREEALRTCLTIFRLSRHFGREPMMFGYLVAVACRSVGIVAANTVLRFGPLSKSSHDILDAELAIHDSTAAFVHALKTERVFGMERFSSTELISDARVWPVRAIFLDDECDYLDLISEQLEFSSQPFSDLVAADIQSKHQGRIGTLSRLFLPALLQYRKAYDRVRARIRCLQVLNALHRRADQGDQSEPKLAELGLAPDTMTDPFTGQPLQLKKTTDGWLVYSAGENLQDDGGDLSLFRDFGVGPKRLSQDDE